PGEISLAHKGVLFLHEMPEFNRKTLEVLRQPLEEGHVTISRALRSTTFPAEFILVAAMNPCPCGYRSDPRRACSCTPPQVEKYLSKISGPLLDRIDLHVEVPAVPFTQLAEMPPGPTSADLRAQVLEARARQAQRLGRRGPMTRCCGWRGRSPTWRVTRTSSPCTSPRRSATARPIAASGRERRRG